jgi:hypothetical protein
MDDHEPHPSLARILEWSNQHVLQFFKYDHLPQHLQDVSAPFADLARQIARNTNNQETTVALRKLLEAKDAAVRAMLIQ